jgi:predicted permease
MTPLRSFRKRVQAFMRKPELDAELEDEIAAHIALAIDENLRLGMSPLEARRKALVRFGGIELAKDRHREARGLMKLDTLLEDLKLMEDLKYTFRILRREIGFTIVAILILALAIGSNIAVFSVVNTILLRPLPFTNAQQLVWIAPPPKKCGLSCATYSTDAYDQFRTTTHSFQDVTGYFAFSGPGNLSLVRGGAPIPATSIDVIANFFAVLGVQAAMGRTFTADDARDGSAPVILISDAWWRTQFNADPAIVGKAFEMNGTQTTVIGVLPRTFDFGAVFSPGVKVDAITPLHLYGAPRNWGNIITFIGRLKPGVSLGQATADSDAASNVMCWNLKFPKTCGNYKGNVIPFPLKDYISGKLNRSLVVLWSAVGAILLIACVNLANLMLARTAARSKEFAMRKALGAGRLRIVRQLLTESLLLSGVGAILGLGIAWAVLAWLAHQGSLALPLLSTLHIDRAALGWTVLIAVFAAIVFGVFPGLRVASGSNLQESLKDSGPNATQSRQHQRIRSFLVVTEVALACVLLVGAGLLLRSFLKVLDVDLGFEPARAAAVKVDYNDNVPGDKDGSLGAQKRSVIFQQILSRVKAIPGVEAAGISDYLPLGQNREWGLPTPKERNPDDFKKVAGPLVYVVSPGYIHAMGTRLTGRDLTWDDGPKSPLVVLISEGMARYFWPNESAVGKVLTNGNDLHVVGVVEDIHEENVEGDTGWQIYYPMTQATPSGAELVIRTTLPPATLASAVMGTLRDLNPKQTQAEFRPIQALVSHATSPRRFFMLLVGTFAGLGLLLAALGIYGVISYSVTQRTQEIGIRMALGSTMGRVQRQILRSTIYLTLWGVALGSVASILLARLIASLLFATSPWDVTAYVGTVVVLFLVALVSGFIPARRASRISPLVALRTN